jgi:hypothetical protein
VSTCWFLQASDGQSETRVSECSSAERLIRPHQRYAGHRETTADRYSRFRAQPSPVAAKPKGAPRLQRPVRHALLRAVDQLADQLQLARLEQWHASETTGSAPDAFTSAPQPRFAQCSLRELRTDEWTSQRQTRNNAQNRPAADMSDHTQSKDSHKGQLVTLSSSSLIAGTSFACSAWHIRSEARE